MKRRLEVLVLSSLVALVPTLAFGHAERPTLSPPRPGSVPDQSRTPTAVLDVCKTAECTYEHIQAAVDVAPDGALIRIWPGVYREEPSRQAPDLRPDRPDGTFSYEFQKRHPNAQNLIAVVGKRNITLRGMGRSPRDVVIDVEFTKHVGIRGDRAHGIIIENLSVWHAYDHGVYILDTDGFVIDRVHSGYSREYPFLTFANDHGLMKDCEAFGGGDGGIYPGGAADARRGKLGRFSMEVARCRSYHNVLGYSGTQSDNVWVHDSEFFDNGVGLVSDSETDHPNYPQNNLVLERNRFHDNNYNPYRPDADVAATVFRGFAAIPIGVGVLLASGNDNLVQSNEIWGHDRYGVWLASGQGMVIGPTSDPPAPPFMSEGNRFLRNRMYGPPGSKPNRVDFAWDGFGLTNCWQDNVRSPSGEPATSELLPLPPCTNPLDGSRLPLTPGIPNPLNAYAQASILVLQDTDGDGTPDRPLCDYTETCGYDWQSPAPAPGKAKNLPPEEGGTTDRSYVPNPAPCGPSTCSTAAGASASVVGARVPRAQAAAAPLPATGLPATVPGAGAALVAAAAATEGVLRRRR
jgi:hypothetical protein